MRLRVAILAITAAAAFLPHRLDASPAIFTDRTLFEKFAGPLEIETFDGEQEWTFDYYNDVCTRYLEDVSIGYDCHGVGFADGVGSFPGGYGISMLFDAPVSAVGFDYDVTGFSYVGISSLGFILAGTGFIGVVDDTNRISTIGVYNPGVYFNPVTSEYEFTHMTMDDLVYTPVPEPSTLLLFGSALALLHHVRLRRQPFIQ